MKIAIVHPNEKSKWSEPLVWDGLHRALEIVAEKHKVDWFLAGDEPDGSYDWIIPWGVGSEPFNNTIQNYRARKALFCAGHPQDQNNFEKFEAIFVESPAVAKQILHPKVVLAFGTDTEFFKPKKEKKLFDVFFPGTYSPWKRQDLLMRSCEGLQVMTCGVVQPDGMEIFSQCEYSMAGLIPTALISKLYNMSKVVVIPAWHGSERTTLEAMSSNVPLVITKDNDLACSLTNDEVIKVDPSPEAIREGIEKAFKLKVNTRDHVLEHYSEQKYAERILEVLE